MTNDQRRKRHVEHALASIRLSGQQPSAKLIELIEQYLNGAIPVGELVALTKERYQTQVVH